MLFNKIQDCIQRITHVIIMNGNDLLPDLARFPYYQLELDYREGKIIQEKQKQTNAISIFI